MCLIEALTLMTLIRALITVWYCLRTGRGWYYQGTTVNGVQKTGNKQRECC